jgi:hypothetical protein
MGRADRERLQLEDGIRRCQRLPELRIPLTDATCPALLQAPCRI